MERSVLATFISRTCVAAAVLAAPTVGQAALITGTTNGSPVVPANLTSLGTTDWAFWNINSATVLSSRAPTNHKSSGGANIAAATNILGSGVRGSTTSLTDNRFSYANGTSPTSATNVQVYGVFNGTLDTLGAGVQTTLTLPDTQFYKVSVWVSGYYATGKLTASLPGPTTYEDSTFSYAGVKNAKLYELQVQGNSAGDVLTIAYRVSADAGDSAHVALAGIAISPVPEPVSLSMLGAAGTLLLRRRSRR